MNAQLIKTVQENSTHISTIQWIIIGIVVICSITISIVDIGIDVADTAVDAATVGTVGVATNSIDLASEVVLEIIQIILISIVVIFLSNDSFGSKAAKIAIIVLAAGIDVVLTILGFLPYVDFVETGGEFITEIVQNAVLFTCVYSLATSEE